MAGRVYRQEGTAFVPIPARTPSGGCGDSAPSDAVGTAGKRAGEAHGCAAGDAAVPFAQAQSPCPGTQAHLVGRRSPGTGPAPRRLLVHAPRPGLCLPWRVSCAVLSWTAGGCVRACGEIVGQFHRACAFDHRVSRSAGPGSAVSLGREPPASGTRKIFGKCSIGFHRRSAPVLKIGLPPLTGAACAVVTPPLLTF